MLHNVSNQLYTPLDIFVRYVNKIVLLKHATLNFTVYFVAVRTCQKALLEAR